MLTQHSAETFNQNGDDISCVTEVTGTTGPTFYTQHTRFNIPAEFGHVVDEDQSEYKKKQTAASSWHLEDFMDAISHQPSKWEDLDHCHMTHDFWGEFGTYLGHNANNKYMVKFPWGNKTTSMKGDMSRKLARTDTSTKDVSQSRLSDESDILLTTFRPAESTQDKTKEVVYQGDFISF